MTRKGLLTRVTIHSLLVVLALPHPSIAGSSGSPAQLHMGLDQKAAVRTYVSGASATGTGASSVLPAASYLGVHPCPGRCQGYVPALGTRLTTPGKELVVWTASLTDGRGTNPVVISFRLRQQVQLTFTTNLLPPILLSLVPGGSLPDLSADPNDAAILESLVDDSAESFLFGMQKKLAYRHLGDYFRDTGASTSSSTPSTRDLYVRIAPVVIGSSGPTRAKLFSFNSTTNLLESASYYPPAGGALVKTTFTWQTVNGEQVPATVVRTQNGQQVFSLSVSGVQFISSPQN